MSKYNAVFFDFDGTYADTSKGVFESVIYALDNMKLERPDIETLRRFIGPPLFDSFKKEYILSDEDADECVRLYRVNYSAGAYTHLDFYPGILELTKKLRDRGIKVAICSSKPEHFIKRIINDTGIAGLIDYAACPALDRATESKCQLITRAAEHLGVSKETIVMIGDTNFDIAGAKEAGVDSIGVLYGFGKNEEMENSGATYLASNVNEIEKIIF